jgi:signal transduction histidine kinase
MTVVSSEPQASFWRRATDGARVRSVLIAAILLGLMMSASSGIPAWLAVLRAMLVALGLMLVFTLLEGHPKTLPKWLARWALQVIAVVIAVPFASVLVYTLTAGSDPRLIGDPSRQLGFQQLAMTGVLFAPWIVVAAVVRQRERVAREQAHRFELERSELERQAVDARLRLLQSQVTPHFLFNTLANVQALVNAGSPRASQVLDHLIEYLRAAVPRLQERDTTLGQELRLVRAYLGIMQMRMPDRLQFALHADPDTEPLHCPPTTLLTLVENAVRHGIDPSEIGGRIEVDVRRLGDRCHVRVTDTGVGLQSAGNGLGTGLRSLRERLRLSFAGDADLQLTQPGTCGVCVELDFPARTQPP